MPNKWVRIGNKPKEVQGTVTHNTGDLTLNMPVFGNGGPDIKVGTKEGTGTIAQMAGSTSAPAHANDIVLYDAFGRTIDSGVALTTKGDLLTYGTAIMRKPVGADGKVLTANSAASDGSGLDWQDAAGNSLFGKPLDTGTPVDGDIIQYSNSTGKWELVIDRPAFVVSAIAGTPLANQLVMVYTAAATLTFPANFATPNSYGTVGTNPTATATYTVYKNGTSVGTVVISTSGVFTFATTGGVGFTLNAGDRLTMVAPSSVDATLADVGVTLVGTRGSTPPSTTPTFPLLNFRGVYDPTVQYNAYDVVTYTVSGVTSTYLCTVPPPAPGYPPTNTSYWALLASGAYNVGSQVGPYASLPSGVSNGQQYQCSDAPYNFIYDGSNWLPFAYGDRCWLPPSMSWQYQGGNTTVATSLGMFQFKLGNGGQGAGVNVYWKTLPSTPYKIHARFMMPIARTSSGNNDPHIGMFLGRSSDGFGYMYSIRAGGDFIIYTVTAGASNFTGISEPGAGNIGIYLTGGLMNLAIEDDGTTKTFGIHDGFGNTSVYVTRGHTQDLTADHAGVYFGWGGGYGDQYFSLISWREF